MAETIDPRRTAGLATESPARPVLSVYARTDPRDPANTSHAPAWQIALRNGLRAVAERLDGDGDRVQQRSFEALRARVERGLSELSPSERGRSVAWSCTPTARRRVD